MKKILIVFGLLLISNHCLWAAEVALKAEDTKALPPGSDMPKVVVKDIHGVDYSLYELVKEKPTVLIFYRGGWCVYCNRHFSELRKVEGPLKEMGYQILAISMDRPGKLAESKKKHQMTYELYSDSQEALASKAFGLAFRVDDKTVRLYKDKFGIDLEADSGQAHHILPVPAVFIIKKDKIVYTYANPDYKVRLGADQLLEAAKKFHNLGAANVIEKTTQTLKLLFPSL